MSRYARSGVARRKIFNLKSLVYLIIILLPAYLIKINVAGIPSNLLEILISLLFVLWLGKKEYRKNLWEIIRNNKKYVVFIGLILIGLLISTKVGGNYRVSLGIIKGWFVFPIIFAALSAGILKKEDRKSAYLALFVSAFLVALISLAYYFLGRITFDGRLQGFFNSPNYLAMYLASGILIGYLWAEEKFYEKKWKSASAICLALALLALAIYLTFSYAAWVSLALSLALVIFLESKNYKKIILIIFLIALSFCLQNGTKKLEDLIKMDDRSSFSSRMMIWNSSKMIIADNWLWGIGPGNFQEKYLEYQKHFPAYLQWAVSHPHDLYFDFWLYSGLIGLAGFLALVVFMIKDLLKKERNFLKLAAMGILFYILFHGIADTTYFKNDLAAVFWMILLAIF